MTETSTTRAYYDNYRAFGWDLSVMHGILRDDPQPLPDSLTGPLRQQAEANYLVLGSATPHNLDNLALIDETLRPGQGASDTVTIVDLNSYTLANHQRRARWLEEVEEKSPTQPGELQYPRYNFQQADMRALGIQSQSMDVVISDYTLNFLSTPEDIAATFGEVSRVLKRNGAFLLAIRGHSGYPYGTLPSEVSPPPAQPYDMLGGRLQKFALDTYLRLAGEEGLELAAPPYMNTTTDILCGLLQPGAVNR